MVTQRDQVIRTAEKYVSKGRIEAAIREYRKVLRGQPNDTNTLNRLGDLYARLQRFDEAVELFGQIAEHYTEDGFFVKAIAIYKKIIKLDPTRLETYEKLAGLYHKQGLVNEARTQYQVLADYYLKHNNSVSAASIYQRMAELEPDNPSHHAKLAELYTEQKLLDKAMDEYATIAQLMISHGHADEAAQVFSRGLSVDPSDIGFITNAVMKLRQAGHPGEAARFLALAVERNPEATKVARLTGMEEREEPPTEEEATADTAVARGEERVTKPGVAEGVAAAEIRAEAPQAVAGEETSRMEEPVAEEASWAVSEPDEERATGLEPPETVPEETFEETAALRAGSEIELDLDEVFVLDLDDDEPSPSLVQPPPDMLDGRPARAFLDPDSAPSRTPEAAASSTVPQPTTADGDVEIDSDFLERTTAELEVARTPNEGDLVSEAEVLAKYGLVDKAVERLEEALRINAHCLEAYELLIEIHVDQKQDERIPRLVRRLATAATEAGKPEVWDRVGRRLSAAGYRLEGQAIEALPPREQRKASGEDRIMRLLSDLLGAEAPRQGVRRPAEADGSPAGPAAAAAPGEAQPPDRFPESEDDFTLHGIFDEVRTEATGSIEAPVEGDAPRQDSGTRWLDEAAVSEGAGGGEPSALFEDEDEFFDLAGELEEELTQEGALGDQDLLVQTQEQTLEEIVEGFKRGVAENLSPEDHATHFNLGIAYREMGLIDEAIGEFQIAAKDRGHLVECCSMLGLCFLDKGLPELAVKWYRQGLAAEDLTEEESLGLLYDMGNTYLAIDDLEAARRTFVEIYGINSNYRDVVAKLEEMRQP